MQDFTKLSDAELFTGSGEQSGSPMSYSREIEIKRRLHLLNKANLDSQAAATEAQKDATRVQRAAIAEMKTQSRIMLWSVIGIFATAVVTLVTGLL